MIESSEKVLSTLKSIRERKDLKLNYLPNLQTKILGYDGKETDLKIRYYQIQGALHLFAMERFILGDHCGLGKTLQAIIALCCIWNKDPNQKVVIVTSKSSVTEWDKEFQRFSKGVTVFYVKDFSEKQPRKIKLYKKNDRVKIDEIFGLDYNSPHWDNIDFVKLAYALYFSKTKRKKEYVDVAQKCHDNIKSIISNQPVNKSDLDEISELFKLKKSKIEDLLLFFSDKRKEICDHLNIPEEKSKELFKNQSFEKLYYLYECEPDDKEFVKSILLKIVNSKSINDDDRQKYDILLKKNNLKAVSAQDQRAIIYEEFLKTTGPCVLLTSYAKVTSDISFFQPMKDFVLITDECTAYKTSNTNIHQACSFLSTNAKRVWGLTATLIKNNLMEGYGIYKVVVPNLFGTKNNFMQTYCIVVLQDIGGRKIPTVKGSRLDQIEKFNKMIEPFYLGRAKHDVASELPPVTVREIEVKISDKERELYQEILSGSFKIGEGANAVEKEVEMLAAINYCQQVVNHPQLIDREGPSTKLECLIDLLTEGDFGDEKVVVFTRFRRMVDIAIPILEKRKIKCTRVTGSENDKQRKKAMADFQDENNKTRVIFITMAGSQAINLQTGKAIVFYDTPYSGGDFIQCLGRISRIGSKHENIYCIHLVCEDTVDERVMAIHKSKMKLIDRVLGKQIKTKESDDVVDSINDISDIFRALKNDAYRIKK